MESNIAGSGSWNRPRKDSFSLSSFRQSEAEQLASDADPWGWVDQDHDEVRQDVSRVRVTAVLVAFDAARWLPDTLAGLDRLQHRPTRLIAIDNGSTDATRTLLDQAVDHGILDAVYSGKRSFGFGAGVKSALLSGALGALTLSAEIMRSPGQPTLLPGLPHFSRSVFGGPVVLCGGATGLIWLAPIVIAALASVPLMGW